MANGGIIGPVNTVNATQCARKLQHLHHQELLQHKLTASADYLVAGGGGAGGA